ncbi:hypothetical protein SFRURICE_021358 [Spodoptera frugiperda]|nr:hypothetical protein SFRURICE_021358 [Spodoptera frugiperda]
METCRAKTLGAFSPEMCYVAMLRRYDMKTAKLSNYVTVSTDTKLCSCASKMCYEDAPSQKPAATDKCRTKEFVMTI